VSEAREVLIAGAARTPIGRFGGSLAPLTAADLGTAAAQEAIRRSGVPAEALDEAVVGCARQAGGGPNVARQVAVRAGLPQERPAFTVNMACGSGLKSLELAARAIREGEAGAVLVAGTESMSRVPYLVPGARWGLRLGGQPLVDAMYQDGFDCPLAGMVMGETAERLAEQHGIGRDEQDAFALRSQQRAGAAQAAGRLDAETFPVRVPGRRGPLELRRDEHLRADTDAAGLARLRPVFRQDGSVTAGNSSGITDGAAALVALSPEAAREHGVEPMARLLGVASVGVDPRIMGIGVVPGAGCWRGPVAASRTSTWSRSTRPSRRR
jgi:acetyl-CoA C-acetyltransferase